MTGVAVITGGGGGIGRAVSIALSEAGRKLVVAGRTQGSLAETVQMLSGGGLAVACDVADETQVDELFDAAVDKFGQVDLLFNNAGIAAPAVPVDELAVDN